MFCFGKDAVHYVKFVRNHTLSDGGSVTAGSVFLLCGVLYVIRSLTSRWTRVISCKCIRVISGSLVLSRSFEKLVSQLQTSHVL